MAAIGSMVFCTDCGNLLESSHGTKNAVLICDVCGTRNKDTSAKTISTRSKPSAFPSILRSKRSEVQTVEAGQIETNAKIRATCEKCGREEVRWYEQQLRSADEGSTITYVCECGHKWTQNN